ncbi:hypothetical protein [Ferdinandcohnia sp. SAFN-114]|uniref:hypothetical protein n=1 Tax=Ferdinandcohnia sp. SAFN-114 TaxID=3387275 RepID=UPI003F7E40C5
MQDDKNLKDDNLLSNTEKDESKNRSIRWSDSVYEETRNIAKSTGKSLDEIQRELLALHSRITLESDHEFGSQINVVNDLLHQLGDRFSSMVTHANTKIELQQTNYEKLKSRTDSFISELQDKNEKLKIEINQLDEEKKKLRDEASSARVDKWRAEEALEKQQKDSGERIGELKDTITEKDEKLAEKNDKIDRLEKEIESMKKAISLNEELKITVESLGNQLDIEKEKHKRELSELKKDYQQQQEISIKNKELEIRSTLQNEFRETLEEKLEEYDRKRESLRQELREQYEQQLLESRTRVKELEQEVKRLRNNTNNDK